MSATRIFNGNSYTFPDDFLGKGYASIWESFWSDVGAQMDLLLGFGALSASSVAIGTGVKAFTLTSADRVFAVGAIVRVQRVADAAVYMVGTVVDQDGAALTIDVPSGFTAGSGTYADWIIRQGSSGLNAPLPIAQGGTGMSALAANVVSLLGAADYAAMRTLLGVPQIAGATAFPTPPAFGASSVNGSHTYATNSQQGWSISFVSATARLVWVGIRLVMTAKGGTISGNVRVLNLPFAAVNRTGFTMPLICSPVAIDLNAGGGYTKLEAFTVPNQTYLEIYESGDAVAAAPVGDGDLVNSSGVFISGFYEAAL